MYSVKLSVLNSDDTMTADFEQATNTFIENLYSVNDLEVLTLKKEVENTRGDLPLWVDIIITGVTTGAFMAIYALAKDMFGIYANSEVQLTFEDGSSIKLKHLTPDEAETVLKNHLEQRSSKTEKE